MTYGRVILGDNQFLGVNHSDQGKATALFNKFDEADAILEVIGWAYEAGVRDFMFTTHDRYYPVFAEIKRSNLFPGLYFTPSLPYAHKYANAMAERGMVDVVLSNLGPVSKLRLASALARSAVGDFTGLMKLLVEVELLMCKGLQVRGVFLLNIMFDLLLGLRNTKSLEAYHSFVADRLGVIPGFFTMNHPEAVKVLCDEMGLKEPWFCSNLNAGGFRMNPSPADVLDSFSSGKSRNIAMSIFASGALSSEESLTFAMKAKGVDAIVFGSSRRENIEKNVARIIQGE
ncbi:hypothetical protein GETHLI_27710 [Geothrix limicola]|uniref:Uncharacterized protein n=1 Tax=Geothrix limicola TaxID=2927978 RepID=A0ABQ5QI59_9BACT|nr:hypothetical protein [Geothrix limicola]GLH74269.1 hypothetical protein GETHLI_27710 [Geothrix limicola]